MDYLPPFKAWKPKFLHSRRKTCFILHAYLVYVSINRMESGKKKTLIKAVCGKIQSYLKCIPVLWNF